MPFLDITGCTLHYRSKRRGFTYYVLGQMAEIAKVIFGMDLQIAVHKQEVVFDTVVVSYKSENTHVAVFPNWIKKNHFQVGV